MVSETRRHPLHAIIHLRDRNANDLIYLGPEIVLQRRAFRRVESSVEGKTNMGTQLYLPAGWAWRLQSRLDPIERLAELEKDRTQTKGDIREILDRLAEKHGATVRDVTAAMLSIDDTLSDLLYDQERVLQHEIEDLSPV